MDWWCSSSRQIWDWTPRPYIGAILVVVMVLSIGVWWRTRGRSQTSTDFANHEIRADVRGTSTGRTIALLFGAVGLWAVLDWPLASLGAGYLASAQMMRQVIMVMVVAPLLLFATPPQLAVRAFGWGRGLKVLQTMARPGFAVPAAAGTLVIVNVPALADPMLQSPFGAFALDIAWVFAGFTLWMPVQCPHPGVKRLDGGATLVYLIAQSVVPVLPGFFMTWSDNPLFSTYELAPRVFAGFDAATDQQTAAAILQVGGMVLLWTQLAYRFISWANRQIEANRLETESMRRATPSAP